MMRRPFFASFAAYLVMQLVTGSPLAAQQSTDEGPSSQPEMTESKEAARHATRKAVGAAINAAKAAAHAARLAAKHAGDEVDVEALDEAVETAAAAAEEAAAAAEAATQELEQRQASSRPHETEDEPGIEDQDLAERKNLSPAEDVAASKAIKPFCSGELCLQPGLRMRLRYQSIQDDPTATYIGRNDGFGLSSGRLKLRGDFGRNVSFNFGIEGGFVDKEGHNIVAGKTFAALKDAWIDLHPFDFLQLRAGQFKVPFDLESLRSTAQLKFADRSVGARGIHLGEGYERLGLASPRDIGIMLGAEDFEVGPIGTMYWLALTNGNGINQAFNDNSLPAIHGRVAVSWNDTLRFGLGGMFNSRTSGNLPNLYDATDTGFTTDLTAQMFGAYLIASYTLIWTQFPTTGQESSIAMAAAGELGYTLWFGLGAAYRFAWFDPTSNFANDSVMEHSIALRYDVDSLPVALVLDYTFAVEQSGRELQNDRIAGVLQLDF